MIAIERTVLVLLAAGRSSRFGGDKLSALLGGKPLGLHAADTLGELPFLKRVAVVACDCTLDYASRGFALIENLHRDEGMGSSLRVGVAEAQIVSAAAVLIVLADMPRVTAAHVRRLFDAAGGRDTVTASSDSATVKPPALFGAAHFDALLAAHGDQGARDLIRAGRHVSTDAAELVDIDTVKELEQLQRR